MKNKYTEEEILDEFKKLGYVRIVKENQTIALHNPTESRTLYILDDNSFAIGIGHPYLVGHFTPIVHAIYTYTFEEKRLIKKLIKLRKEKTNENQIN